MSDSSQHSPQAQQQVAEALEERDHASTGAPTISGGQVGANMSGGGQIGDPELTDDKLGNPGGGGPIVLDKNEDDQQDRFTITEE
jgi:hypothetical protein